MKTRLVGALVILVAFLGLTAGISGRNARRDCVQNWGSGGPAEVAEHGGIIIFRNGQQTICDKRIEVWKLYPWNYVCIQRDGWMRFDYHDVGAMKAFTR